MRPDRRITATVLAGLWACVQATHPELEGGALSLQFEQGAAAWDSVKVFVRGITNKTVKVTPGATVTIDGLIPGTYTIALAAFDSGGVASFFQTSNVGVVANQNANITPTAGQFASFVPVLGTLPSSATSTTFPVSFGSVTGAASYEIEAATNSAFTANRVAVPAMETSTQVTVPTYGTYFVRVRAIDAYDGRGRACPPKTIVIATLPASLGGLVASDISRQQINLSWIDNATNEDGFRIERCSGSGCTTFSQIAALGANITSYQNSGLSSNTSYSYRVRAYNAAGSSTYSNMASATTRK